MNIFEASDTALWQSQEHLTRTRPPKLDPRAVGREHLEGGMRTVIAIVPGADGYYRIAPNDWAILQLFDGERSIAEVAELHTQNTGVPHTEEYVQMVAEAIEPTNLLYKAPHEKSRAVMEELVRHRRKLRRKSFDLANINLANWNSDAYFEWIYPKLRFIFTRWFTALTLFWFGVMGFILFDHRAELWQDSFQFYNFLHKGFADLVEFWILLAVVIFFHETAHGLTCSHFATGVHRMGFTLMYFMPTFYCDVSESWVYARKWERIAIMFAGCWVELMICAAASVVWWGTTPGMVVHDVAYKVLLVAGLAIILLNLNPLIKLDGYYIFCELIGIPDLMEKAKEYVSNWVRSVVGLPCHLDYLRPGRKFFYIFYACLTGVYSYVLIFVLVTWTYNIAHAYSPEWAFAPALLVFFVTFRTPARKAVAFMKLVYSDKKDLLHSKFTTPRLATLAVFAAVLLFAPVWRDTISAPFMLEAPTRAVVRAEVPGIVTSVGAMEGQTVAAGDALVQLRNLALESDADHASTELKLANARSFNSQLRYADFATADRERQERAEQAAIASGKFGRLTVNAPISGVVATPHAQDLLGSYVTEGTELAEIVQLSTLRARIYIPESALRDVRMGAAVSLLVNGSSTPVRARLQSLSPRSSEPDETIVAKPDYQGYQLPHFYTGFAEFPNPGALLDGMRGQAKIMVRRRSIAGITWEAASAFFSRRVW
jgi:putative peptide zinc metalloprotease protein